MEPIAVPPKADADKRTSSPLCRIPTLPSLCTVETPRTEGKKTVAPFSSLRCLRITALRRIFMQHLVCSLVLTTLVSQVLASCGCWGGCERATCTAKPGENQFFCNKCPANSDARCGNLVRASFGSSSRLLRVARSNPVLADLTRFATISSAVTDDASSTARELLPKIPPRRQRHHRQRHKLHRPKNS